VTFVPITEADVVDAEKNQHRMDGDVELLYEREWAAALLRRTNERLEQECAVAGKARLLAHLKPHLTADGANDYQALSQTLGRPVATLRSDVGRFRARYRAILREEVAGTVQSPSDIDDELRYLFKVVAATG
jgi:RNA polymerase sigma-70 factor (ECF subfamily)